MAFAYDNGTFRWEGDAPMNAVWAMGDLKPMTHCPFCEHPFEDQVQDQEDDEEECQYDN